MLSGSNKASTELQKLQISQFDLCERIIMWELVRDIYEGHNQNDWTNQSCFLADIPNDKNIKK